MRALVAAVVCASLPAVAIAASPRWQSREPLPLPRTEVAAARHGTEIAVVGGYLPWGDTSAQADAYSPAQGRWRRLPDLPVAVNHAAAATWRGKAVLAGGYLGRGAPSDRVFLLENDEWRELARMPAGRAAAGAAVIGDTLFVVAGIGPTGLTRTSYALDLRTNRWRGIPGPTPREHLAVTAAGGRVYALAGRVGGLDGNLRVLESWRPGERRWRAHPRIPSSRGGTAASTVDRMIVSIGGEAPGGTIASVYAYDTRTRRWRRLPDLPTPRHGLGAVTFGRSVYAIAGGPRPGLTTSGANEVLTLPEQRRLAAASGPAAASVVTVAFRTHGAITCGTELFPHEGTSRSLVCWRPRTGFAVSMTHLGRAFVRSSAAYRNWASEAPAAQLRPRETWWVSARRTVGRGTPPTGSLFRCTAGSNGLTCANAAGRGWWLGRAGGYRSR